MADSMILEQLKSSRTNARRQFQRQTNNAARMLSVMSEQELKDTFKSLTMEANKVLEANEDVEEQYGLESALEGGALTEEQRRDLDKLSSECEAKLSELKDLIVQTLWAKFGEEELSLAVEAAEAEAQRAEAVQPSEDKEIFDFRIEHLGELVRRTKELHTQWKSWAPPEEQQQLQKRVRELERALMTLTARKAEFIKVRGKNKPRSTSTGQRSAPSTSTGQRSAPSTSTGHREASATTTAHISSSGAHRAVIVSLPDPRSLPVFPGPSADLQRWRKEWEELQERGDPSGSGEMKREQLLSSLDDRTTAELQLSKCSTAEEIFTELERRYGNQTNHVKEGHHGNETNSAVEMVEELLKEGDFSAGQEAPECIVCGHSKHGLRLYFCRKFQALKLKEKKEVVRRLGACRRCLEVHAETDQCKTEFLCQREECSADQHHYSLCPRKERPRTFTALKTKVTTAQGGGAKPRSYLTLGGGVKPQVYSRVTAVGGVKPPSYSRAQQEFVKKLPPELAKEFKQVFRSSAPRTTNNHSAARTAQPSGANAPPNQSFRGFRGWTHSQF